MNDMVVETTLVARTYLYRMFQMLFGDDPTKETLSAVFSETTKEALGFFRQAESSDYAAALEGFSKCASAYGENSESCLARAQRDYMQLLVGPNELKAPPWGCVYLTNERVLFQESTLKVREAYRSENMLPTQYPHVSDDHIAIELDFLAKLSEKTQAALSANDTAEYGRLLESQRAFLNEHLLVWVDKYATDLSEASSDSLYARIAMLCAAFLPIDVEVIGELLDRGKEGKMLCAS